MIYAIETGVFTTKSIHTFNQPNKEITTINIQIEDIKSLKRDGRNYHNHHETQVKIEIDKIPLKTKRGSGEDFYQR